MHRLRGAHLDRESLLASPWPVGEGLDALQAALAAARPEPLVPGPEPRLLGGVFVCWPRGATGSGAAGDRGWAGAAATRGEAVLGGAVVEGVAGAPYVRGSLAAREGPILAAAARALDRSPDVLLVDATGSDHPRRGGLARHLGAVLDLPTVGVTNRPLAAGGAAPTGPRGTTAPLTLHGETVAVWLVVREGTRPVVVHPGWRTDLRAAVAVVLESTARTRTPAPLREARRLARTARALGIGAAL